MKSNSNPYADGNAKYYNHCKTVSCKAKQSFTVQHQLSSVFTQLS